MDGPRLHKAVSDLSAEFNTYNKIINIDNEPDITKVVQVTCECCGLREECTEPYIAKIRESHSGKWVCGLCSEAVKDRRLGKLTIKEALISHMEFCQRFNNTTRVNPKLSLTCTMKEIAKRSSQHRSSGKLPVTGRIHRSSSCVPRIDH